MATPAIAIMKCSEQYYLMLCDDGNIQGFESLAEGVASFERAYNQAHGRSYEGSMSACIGWLFAQPSILEWPGVETIKTWLANDRALSINAGGAMFFTGALIKPELAQKLWESGTKPHLVRQY